MEEVDKSTKPFAMTKRNEEIAAGAKGDTILFSDALGKKTERRASLSEEGFRKADTTMQDVRRFAEKCAAEEELREKVEEFKAARGASREAVQKRCFHWLEPRPRFCRSLRT